jgi:hypothetical protein
MGKITTPPVTWQVDGWQQQDKKVSASFALEKYKVRVFNTPDDVKNQFFPNHNEVEIGPGDRPVLALNRAFFIEPRLVGAHRNPINSHGYSDMRESNSARTLHESVGDTSSLAWIKQHNIQVAWMKNMPDLSEETFSSFGNLTHIVDLTDSSYFFPWEAIDEYEAHKPLAFTSSSRKDLFIAHEFYPIQRVFIPKDSEGNTRQISGTIYVKTEEID